MVQITAWREEVSSPKNPASSHTLLTIVISNLDQTLPLFQVKKFLEEFKSDIPEEMQQSAKSLTSYELISAPFDLSPNVITLLKSPSNSQVLILLCNAPSEAQLSPSFSPPSKAQLSPSFYSSTCPNALTTIRTSIRQAVSRERLAASLIRLHFHDCFVQGCDASILLDETPSIQSEKTVFPNVNSVRGFEVIEAAKREVEKICPGVVSCADILAVGGPSWNVNLGRRDSTTASGSVAKTDLPSPFSNLSTLISAFANKGLSARDMVALSDQVLFSGGSTDSIVSEYSRNPRTFLSDFGNSMIKMGDIEPLTGQNGIIRRICSAIN
ncbi:Peroxidase 5 [Abeliophyllum distichum]|uniref:Peroxidase n=1 Tax=Abeliophyllum distichum TaxID=126358 RepID=A0ABD1NSS1_9LAMI